MIRRSLIFLSAATAAVATLLLVSWNSIGSRRLTQNQAYSPLAVLQPQLRTNNQNNGMIQRQGYRSMQQTNPMMLQSSAVSMGQQTPNQQIMSQPFSREMTSSVQQPILNQPMVMPQARLLVKKGDPYGRASYQHANEQQQPLHHVQYVHNTLQNALQQPAQIIQQPMQKTPQLLASMQSHPSLLRTRSSVNTLARVNEALNYNQLPITDAMTLMRTGMNKRQTQQPATETETRKLGKTKPSLQHQINVANLQQKLTAMAQQQRKQAEEVADREKEYVTQRMEAMLAKDKKQDKATASPSAMATNPPTSSPQTTPKPTEAASTTSTTAHEPSTEDKKTEVNKDDLIKEIERKLNEKEARKKEASKKDAPKKKGEVSKDEKEKKMAEQRRQFYRNQKKLASRGRFKKEKE